MRTKGLFIVGAERGVGKTVVASGLAAALRRRGARVGVMKPVEVGCTVRRREVVRVDGVPGELSPEAQRAYTRLNELVGPPPITDNAKTSADMLESKDASRLMRFSGCFAAFDIVNPYRFHVDVVPLAASMLAGVPIEPERLLGHLAQLQCEHDVVVVEGHGGVMEPLARQYFELDFVEQSGLAALLVGTTEQRMANHVLGATELLRQRGVRLAGVVLRRPQGRMEPKEAVVPQLIDSVLGDAVRGVLPFFDSGQLADGELLAERFEVHLDVDAILANV